MYKALVNASEKPIEEKSKPENNEQSNNEGENNKSEDNTENNEKDSSDTKSSTKKKVITKDKDLLLACSYFDLGKSFTWSQCNFQRIGSTLKWEVGAGFMGPWNLYATS